MDDWKQMTNGCTPAEPNSLFFLSLSFWLIRLMSSVSQFLMDLAYLLLNKRSTWCVQQEFLFDKRYLANNRDVMLKRSSGEAVWKDFLRSRPSFSDGSCECLQDRHSLLPADAGVCDALAIAKVPCALRWYVLPSLDKITFYHDSSYHSVSWFQLITLLLLSLSVYMWSREWEGRPLVRATYNFLSHKRLISVNFSAVVMRAVYHYTCLNFWLLHHLHDVVYVLFVIVWSMLSSTQDDMASLIASCSDNSSNSLLAYREELMWLAGRFAGIQCYLNTSICSCYDSRFVISNGT